MKKIETIENLKAAVERNEMSSTEFGQHINYTFYWAYINARENSENSLLDFNEVIWDRDIEAIVKHCKEFNIKTFTVSSAMSNLIETLAEFEKHGCAMAGLVKVNARYTDWQTGKKKVIPAILMTVN